MGLTDHGAAQFINAKPLLLAILLGLFPGVFEETGRLVAFKTVLRKRKNKETSISHGIGHGGFEVVFILGLTFFEYIIYGIMINTGAINSVMEQVKAAAPDQYEATFQAFNSISAFNFGTLGIMMYERVFAFLLHVGLSILVFYACRDKGKFWLYPLAIIFHTVIDGLVGFQYAGLIELTTFGSEAWVTVTALLTFASAYFLVYKKDNSPEQELSEPVIKEPVENTEE
jgi:uncharacterized membrane protein YhfC